MEVPNWCWDDIRPRYGDAAYFAAVTIFRYGSPMVGPGGERRCVLRQTIAQFSRAAGFQSKRTLEAALACLREDGRVIEHRAVRPGAPRGFSAPLECAKFAHSSASGFAQHHDGDDPDPSLIPDQDLDLTTTIPDVARYAQNLRTALGDAGVTNPAMWIEQFGVGAVASAMWLTRDWESGTWRSWPPAMWAALKSGEARRRIPEWLAWMEESAAEAERDAAIAWARDPETVQRAQGLVADAAARGVNLNWWDALSDAAGRPRRVWEYAADEVAP